ncbi:hypothetical protein ABIA32_002718 [Streptacidiphilus sp. MAP12-20]|uniref:hypothetical protein n=1 Tax=Streptacidiphilus sp. MAP12-20 TaxID=3156299 RepID=UPI003511B46C
MADRTGAARPTPPQLRIRLVGAPDEVDIAVHRLRSAFATIEADKPSTLMYDPELVRVHVKAVL